MQKAAFFGGKAGFLAQIGRNRRGVISWRISRNNSQSIHSIRLTWWLKTASFCGFFHEVLQQLLRKSLAAFMVLPTRSAVRWLVPHAPRELPAQGWPPQPWGAGPRKPQRM